MKHSILTIILLLALSFMVSCSQKGETEENTEKIDTMELLITRIHDCSRLYTAEVDVHKIITHDDDLRLNATIMNKPVSVSLPMGERKIAIPIDATLKAYVDFSDFSKANVIRTDDKIEIILPDPKVVLTQTKVRNEDIRKQVPLLRRDFSDKELTAYEAQGRKDIIETIPKLNIIPMAQEGCANVLIPLLEQMGYKEENITVTFRKEFTISDIRKLIVND